MTVRAGPIILAGSALVALAAVYPASSARAQSSTLPFPGKYVAPVEIRGYPSDSSCVQLYTVPASYILAVTDVVLDSYGSTTPIPYQYICSGAPTCSLARSAYMTAPAGNALVLNYTSGIIVKGGETLSVCNYGGLGKIVSWSMRGFFYEPTPGSNVAPTVTAVAPGKMALQPPLKNGRR